MKRAEIIKPREITSDRPLCVFGIMDNPKGQTIADEMRPWLKQYYQLIEVWHDGSQFELPALQEARKLSLSTHSSVLYIHSRGAVNEWGTTIPTRRLWRHEFGSQWRKYFDICKRSTPTVVCPFVDYDRETRYNGFVANYAAWERCNLYPSMDRMVYERLWCKDTETRVMGTIFDGNADINKIRKFLLLNYGQN